jgi:hypothetical protein
MRRTWLRGRQKVQKRYLIQVAAYNLGMVLRARLGARTPKQLAARGARLLWLLDPEVGLLMTLILPPDTGPGPTSSTGCYATAGATIPSTRSATLRATAVGSV